MLNITSHQGNTNQNYSQVPFTLKRLAKIKAVTNVDEAVEKLLVGK